MSKAFKIAFASMAAIIAIAIWIGFAATKGNHLAPTGHIGKVRVQAIGDDSCFMVIDFNVKNDSDRNMIVHSIEITVDTPEGSATGGPVAAKDIVSAFKDYPALGELYNPVLKDRDIVPAHQELDRMVAASFDVPAAKIENRTKVTLRVTDATGAELLLTQ
jgi:hypothetical protein